MKHVPQTRTAGVETKIVECGHKNKCAGVCVQVCIVCKFATSQVCNCARVQVCGRINEELDDLDVQ